MHVRDAVEDDARALAARADLPADAVRQLIHERTVCVVEPDDGSTAGADDSGPADDDSGPTDDASAGNHADLETAAERVLGFLAFDADEGAVHVTQVAGEREAVELLLEEPVRFARNEGMPVEVLVPDADATVVRAVEAAGFEQAGTGPRFDGEATRRYRLAVSS